MALPIQVTSCWVTRPRKAVTSPPPPRLTTRAPAASRAYDSGPRFATMMSFRGPATRGPYRVLDEVLDEAKPRAALAGLRLDLELIRDRPDDRDPEPALGELVAL